MNDVVVNLLATQNELLSKIYDLGQWVFVVLVFIAGYCLFDEVRYLILRKVQ